MMMNEYGARRGYDDRWDGRWENPDWWLRDGRSYDGHLRRNAGDWMRESPWTREREMREMREMPWGSSPWSASPWGVSPWQWQSPSPWAHGPWLQAQSHVQGQGPWGQPWGHTWGQPWGTLPWGRESGWARDWSRVEGGVEPMVKVIEVFAESPHSWEDATRRAIAEASTTVRGIRSIYIKDMQAVVEEDRVIGYRINAKISFVLEDNRRRR